MPEDITAILKKEEGKRKRLKMDEKKITQQLDDSELEEISGGYLFNASVLFEYDVLPWQVLDRHGKVVAAIRREKKR